MVEQGLADAEMPFQTAGGPRQDKLRRDVKLGVQLRLSLLGQVGRTQDGQARRLAPVEEFSGD